MASKGLQGFSRSLNALRPAITNSKDPLTQCLAPRFTRTMATETAMPADAKAHNGGLIRSTAEAIGYTPIERVTTTIYKFPSMEPLHFQTYPAKWLHLPLRRDILHRAIVFEGDGHRQGTGSTKTRYEIHGSHRKIRPQKGSGRARLGTRQAPHLEGGAKAHGPKPRDFSTDLPRKMYDLAWRTALSMRYRRGELLVCADGVELEYDEERYARALFEWQGWGQAFGKTLIVTGDKGKSRNLLKVLGGNGGLHGEGRAMLEEDVDVKDLLEMGRVVIEKQALEKMLLSHQSDLTGKRYQPRD